LRKDVYQSSVAPVPRRTRSTHSLASLPRGKELAGAVNWGEQAGVVQAHPIHPALKGQAMKTPLIAALLIAIAGAASAQTAASGVAPKVAADKAATAGERAEVRTERANRQAERKQEHADRAAGNTAAVKIDQQAKKEDTAEMKADRAQVKEDQKITRHQRTANHRRQAASGN
jgi:hypothetical protein